MSTAYTPTTTPGVSFTYDTPYNRVLTMVDGTGTTHYSYNLINAQLGAGRLSGVTVPIEGTGDTAAVTYTTSTGAIGYDELGRVVGRDVDHATTNANNTGTVYDALGRVTQVTNALASRSPGFQYAYVSTPNPSNRLLSVTYPTSTGMSTSYSYFANAAPTGTGNGDQRLETITHKQGSTQLSNFGHTYNPVGTIATWTQQTTSGSTATTNTLSYDTADQLTKDVQSGGATASNAYNYDPDGNRLLETTLTGATAGQFNNLNQLKGLTAGPGMQTVAGHTSAAVSSVNLDTVAATLSGSTNFTANVSMPSGTNIVSVVAQPSATGTTPTRKSTRSWPRARLPPR